jgi:hypothetical protein
MPTDKNVPPLDSFERDGAQFAPEKRIDMHGDGHLGDVFNPTRGKDRLGLRGEQYDTHTWSPGGSGERRSGSSPLETGIKREQFGTVHSVPGVNASLKMAGQIHIEPALKSEQFRTVPGRLA